MLKGIGALLILASAAGIGASFSSDLKGRCMELRLLKQMIYMQYMKIKDFTIQQKHILYKFALANLTD